MTFVNAPSPEPRAACRAWRRALVAGLTSAALGGCVTMHDLAPRQALPPSAGITLPAGIPTLPAGWPAAAWWHRYADPQLDALVERALAHAPSLAAARARVEAADAQARLVDAGAGPKAGLSVDLDRESVSANGFLGPYGKTVPALGTTGPWYTEGTLGLGAEFDVDLWGRDRARTHAALGAAQARAAEAALAELLLSARIVDAYYDAMAQSARLELLRRARAIEHEAAAAHAARFAQGLEARSPAELAHERELSLDARILAVDGRIGRLREVLRALLGASGAEEIRIEPRALPSVAGELPDALGYELLARRPDLQARRWMVQASLDQIDAARAAFYPSLDLRSFVGFDALHLNDLFRSSSRQFGLVPGLNLPVFDSGRLNANLAASRAQSDALIADYDQAIVDAVRDVAQGCIALDTLARQAAVQGERLDAVRFAAAGAQAHYRRGLTDRIAALEAELPVLGAREQALDLQAARIQAQVALIVALGGGYDSRSGTAEQPPHEPS